MPNENYKKRKQKKRTRSAKLFRLLSVTAIVGLLAKGLYTLAKYSQDTTTSAIKKQSILLLGTAALDLSYYLFEFLRIYEFLFSMRWSIEYFLTFNPYVWPTSFLWKLTNTPLRWTRRCIPTRSRTILGFDYSYTLLSYIIGLLKRQITKSRYDLHSFLLQID